MSDLLITALAALKADQARLESISVNAANAGTPGYRRQVFASALDAQAYRVNTMTSGAAPVGGLAVGASVSPRVALFSVDSTRGSLMPSGRPLDLAIEGEGYFVLNDQGRKILTRAGSLKIDAQGFLVDVRGLRIQAIEGDVHAGADASLMIDAKGGVYAGFNKVAQLLIQTAPEGKNLFTRDGILLESASGEYVNARPEGFSIKSGFLEASNSGGIRDSVGTVEVVRHYESTIRVLQGYDDMLGKAIQKLGDF